MYNYVQTIWFAEYTLSNKEKISVVVLGTVMSAFPACVMVRDSSRRWNVWTELLHVPACSLAATFFLRNLHCVCLDYQYELTALVKMSVSFGTKFKRRDCIFFGTEGVIQSRKIV